MWLYLRGALVKAITCVRRPLCVRAQLRVTVRVTVVPACLTLAEGMAVCDTDLTCGCSCGGGDKI
jgi:hypothetical protein